MCVRFFFGLSGHFAAHNSQNNHYRSHILFLSLLVNVLISVKYYIERWYHEGVLVPFRFGQFLEQQHDLERIDVDKRLLQTNFLSGSEADSGKKSKTFYSK